MAIAGLFAVLLPSALTADPSCAKAEHGVCLTAAKPILRIIKGTKDPAACCAQCLNLTTCVSWNVNSAMDQCFLRAVAGPTNPGSQCISGQTGRKGPPSPPPGPGPGPPPPPPGPPPPRSDQRPRFHFAPTFDATNDIQGPFYDPRHQLYHMGFAWHVNGTHGIGSAPNRWWHQVSKDLAHWQIVSTTPERAMLKPDTPYDNLAVMTGSVTIVDGVPNALFSCRGSENRARNWSSATVALAQPSNLTDPLLVDWTKSKKNPVLNPGPGTAEQGFHPSGMPIANGFRDPSTAWLSGGQWRVLTSCEHCNGSDSSLGLFSAPALEGPWEFTSTPLPISQLECPDYWPVIPAPGSDVAAQELAANLSAIKLSHGGKEIIFVGTMDPNTQTLINLVPPLVNTGNTGSLPTQLMDASTYASKSFYDPVNKQQVWTSWVHDAGSYCAHNASVCSTHTLPRTLLWDAEIRAHVTPPIPQTQLLRKAKLHSLAQPMPLGADAFVALPAAVEASGMQLEIEATFALPFPPGLRAGLAVRRSQDGLQSTQSCIDMGSSPAPMTPCVTSPDDDARQQAYRTTADGTDQEHSSGQAAAEVLGNTTVASVSVLVSNTNDLDEWSRTHKNGTEFHGGRLRFPVKPSDENVTLRIFVDHSVVESYAQGGRAVVTQRSYPTDDALGVAVGTASRGGGAGITVLALNVWEIGTIWVNKV